MAILDIAASVGSFVVLLSGLLATSVYLLYLKRKIDQSAQIAKFAEEIEAAKQRLEKSNQRFLALFEGARDVILVFDSASGTTLDANLAAEKLTLRPKHELVGLHYTGILTDIQGTSAEVTLRQVLCTGEGEAPVAAAIITSDQQQIPVEISANWIEIDDKCVVQAIIRDVGQRKRAEAELHRVNRALSTLSKCDEALVHATAENELLTGICQMLVDEGGYRGACIEYLNDDPLQMVHPAAEAGFENDFVERTGIKRPDTAGGRGPTITAIRTSELCLNRDILHDPQLAHCHDEATRRGYAPSISLPLKKDSCVFGVLTVYAGETNAFDNNEVELLTQLADDLAYGIMALRTEAKGKLAEAALRESEQCYRMLFARNPHPMWIFDMETLAFLEINGAAIRHYGYSREEFLHMTLKDIRPPEDIPALMANLSLHKGGYKLPEQFRHKKKDGTIIYVEISSFRFVRDGRTVALMLANDITERERAHEELKQSEARLRRLTESNVIGILFGGVHGNITDANDAFLRMLGYTREDLGHGLRWRDLVAPEFKALSDANLRQMLETGTFGPVEKEYIRKDGARLPVLVGGAANDEENRPAIVFVLDLTELKKAQTEIDRLARIVESTDEAIISLSLDGRILSWNRGAERLYGYAAPEIIGKSSHVLFPENRKKEYGIVKTSVESGRSLDNYETVHIAKSGELKPVSLTVSPMRDESGQIVGMSTIVRDLTQTKKTQQLEEQFRQAQRLESLGRLTGGVAHDFNNLLMVISSYTEMLQERLPPEDPLRRNTQQVLKASERAADLTQQLLAFSRKQVLSPQIIDLNAVVDETAKMVKRLIGEDIELMLLPTKPLWPVTADPGQMTQVLMNLCVNARDAMQMGGKLTIETQNVVVDAQTAAKHPAFLPGNYAMLAVSDTGVGMTKEVRERLFEPFFTSKERGKGTGLGLATVYGIVKQSGGYIWVYSEPNNGSCFKLYFPRVDQPVTTTMSQQSSTVESHGETILVAEDEDSLRESISEYLKELGYMVLKASDGQQALELADHHGGRIHLLLTDVIMPKMSGAELARRLACRSGMVTLFMSGYTDDAIVNHGVLQAGMAFIQKPFSLSALARKVRELLNTAS